jgi:uncharacterized metal-binding protein
MHPLLNAATTKAMMKKAGMYRRDAAVEAMFDELRCSVATAIETGAVLNVASEAERIAAITGSDAEEVANELVNAGLMARINLHIRTRNLSAVEVLPFQFKLV